MRAPRVGDATVQRALDELYAEVEKLQEGLRQNNRQSNTLELRMVEDDKGSYHLEVKLKEGWVRMQAKTFTLK
jgi:hypothetical protein